MKIQLLVLLFVVSPTESFEHLFAIPIEISSLIHSVYGGFGLNEWIYEIPERFHWSIQSNLVAEK